MNIKEAWIKAAIESVTLEIDYYSDRTKKEYSTREVEPDYYGWGLNNKNHGLWGINRIGRGVRCFKEDSVLDWRVAGNRISPNQHSRSSELLEDYKLMKLDTRPWPKDKIINPQD